MVKKSRNILEINYRHTQVLIFIMFSITFTGTELWRKPYNVITFASLNVNINQQFYKLAFTELSNFEFWFQMFYFLHFQLYRTPIRTTGNNYRSVRSLPISANRSDPIPCPRFVGESGSGRNIRKIEWWESFTTTGSHYRLQTSPTWSERAPGHKKCKSRYYWFRTGVSNVLPKREGPIRLANIKRNIFQYLVGNRWFFH